MYGIKITESEYYLLSHIVSLAAHPLSQTETAVVGFLQRCGFDLDKLVGEKKFLHVLLFF